MTTRKHGSSGQARPGSARRGHAYPVKPKWQTDVKAKLLEIEMTEKELAGAVKYAQSTMHDLLNSSEAKHSSLVPAVHRALGWDPPADPEAAPPIFSADALEMAGLFDRLPEEVRLNVLADIGEFGFFTNTSNIVTRAELQQNRAAIKSFLIGLIEAMHYVKTNREGSLKILRKYLQISDADAVEGTYKFFADRLPRTPRTELEGIKNILTSINAGQRNPGEFVDMSLIDEIEKENFVQKVYGS